MSCGVGHRCGSDSALLWLWCRLAAVAQIRPLAWEPPPYAAGTALKRPKKEFLNLLLIRLKNILCSGHLGANPSLPSPPSLPLVLERSVPGPKLYAEWGVKSGLRLGALWRLKVQPPVIPPNELTLHSLNRASGGESLPGVSVFCRGILSFLRGKEYPVHQTTRRDRGSQGDLPDLRTWLWVETESIQG